MRLCVLPMSSTASEIQKNNDFGPVKNRKATHMAVNVTQKDKTLNDVIEWCEKHVARIVEKIPNASDEGFLTGERFALQAVAAHCEELLGYSGSMPLEVPNQSEKVSR